VTTRLDSTSVYADRPPEERLRHALYDIRAYLDNVSSDGPLDVDDLVIIVSDIVNQGLCTGRASGCGCDWCQRYQPEENTQ
jgi:hypothetical protein